MSKGKSFIRVDYLSTSLLSCARIANSCPSYTKRSTFGTKQNNASCFPSFPGATSLPVQAHHPSSFLNIAITTKHMELHWYQALVLNLQECYHLEKACDVHKLGHVCFGWLQAPLLPAVLRNQVKESMHYVGVKTNSALHLSKRSKPRTMLKP